VESYKKVPEEKILQLGAKLKEFEAKVDKPSGTSQ
jgi:hypothetical protein